MRRPAFHALPTVTAIKATAVTLPLMAGLALSAPMALAEMPEGITHFTLPNGLETVVIEDRRAPVVVQMVWYRIGAADEVPGKSGIAHYLEHLMFKGTDTLEPGEFSRIVTANGGSDNAFTSWDFTAYFQRIASDRLPLIMEMEADRMANLSISDDDWLAERQVVLEERAQRVDSDPRALFAEELNAVLYDNHPYGRPIIGWRDEIEALTLDDANAWYEAHYAPDDAILIVAGDVSADEVRALAEEHYGPVTARGDIPERARPQEPPKRADRRIEMSDPRVPQPQMTRRILAPERNAGAQEEAAALTVLAELLGGSTQTSVLGRELVLTGKALFAGSRYSGLSLDPTDFAISLVPADGVAPADAEAALDAALARFLDAGPDADDLERVKTRIRASEIFARDSAHGRAYDYGQGLATGLTVEDVNDWPRILGDVTADQVMAAARKVLAQPGSVTGWLLPAEAGANSVAQQDTAPLPAPPPSPEPHGPASDAPATPSPEVQG